eukprot:5980121-Amphidinium_carterae.3
MAMRRSFPPGEHPEVFFWDEAQVHPESPVRQLVAVTDDATAAIRRRQERTLLFAYAGLPSPDFFPPGGPEGLPEGEEWDANDPNLRSDWWRTCISRMEMLCREPRTPVEALGAYCSQCHRRSEEVDLYRCVACVGNYICWEHAIFPACLEGLEILMCAGHKRITPGVGIWHPPGGGFLSHPPRETRGLGDVDDSQQAYLAELNQRPDLEARRLLCPRTQLHLRRLEAAEGSVGFNPDWRRQHERA